MAILIRAAGGYTKISPKNGKTFELEEMYELIGCRTVERIPLADGLDMWLDEEGKFREIHHVNLLATRALHEAGGLLDDYVVGDVLICDRNEVD